MDLATDCPPNVARSNGRTRADVVETMELDLILAYAGGLLTLINPCVLPVLPIVLASATASDRRAPLALAAGMSLSFVALGLLVAALGPALGVDPVAVSEAAAIAMVAFGAILLVPALSGRFSMATAGLAARADAGIAAQGQAGLGGQFLSGTLLGAVWSPCIGPTLGAAIALASSGESLGRAGAIMVAFAAGVSTLILALAYGAGAAIRRRQARMRRLAELSKPIMGSVFIVIGLIIWFGLFRRVETWLVQNLPAWLVDLSVSI